MADGRHFSSCGLLKWRDGGSRTQMNVFHVPSTLLNRSLKDETFSSRRRQKCHVLCLAAGEAGGWDSHREGQMETKTSVCHGSRNAGKSPPRLLPPFFLSSLQQAAVSPSLPVPSSGFSTCESSGTLSFCTFLSLF